VLDTSLFIRAFRDPRANVELQRFHGAFAPFEYLSAVVVQELRAGTRPEHVSRLERQVFEPFERVSRVVTPTYAAWKRGGEVLAALARTEGLELGRIPRSFVNDLLLAASCREAGITLITENRADFARIRRLLAFDFVAPWPRPSS